MDFIEAKMNANPNLASSYENLGSLFNKKLWHQLTIALESFLVDPQTKNEDYHELYKQFISKFETRLSPLKLADILSKVGDSHAKPNDSIEFYTDILTANRAKLGIEAAMCIDIDIVLAKLKAGLLTEGKTQLDELQQQLGNISSAETIVHSKFYHASSELRKTIGPPQEYYKAALLYLAYTPLESLSVESKYELATDISLAAATSEGIFNFGEVLTNPIISVLKNTPNEWLYNLMIALHHGDINEFNKILGTYNDQYFKQPALASRHEEVKKKIVLLCLVTMIFERHPHDRILKFSDIAIRTQVPLNQVEWVIMTAMSLGLIKGSIEEVEQTVDVSWVIPRVLEMDQLKHLSEQLSIWSNKTKQALVTVEERAPELYM